MRDSTHFESCSLFRAVAQPATFPDGIEPRFRALLSRTETPCATASAPNPEPALIHAVCFRSIRLEDSTGTAFLYVRHGEDTHHEDFKMVRRGERWWVTEVRLWGAVQSYTAYPHPR